MYMISCGLGLSGIERARARRTDWRSSLLIIVEARKLVSGDSIVVLQVNKRKIKTFLGRIRGRVAENDELLFLHHRATVIMLYSCR